MSDEATGPALAHSSPTKALVPMKASLPLAAVLAIPLTLLLAFGPLVTGLDLMLHFLPAQFPAIRDFHMASPMGHALWVASGFVGVLTALLLLRRRPVLAPFASLAFSMVYITGAQMVWFRFTFGCWLAIASAMLVVLGGRAMRRSNTSFKPDLTQE